MEKVLIIIDEDKMRELYVKFFACAGCIVRQASDLLNGLSLLMEEKMDLVLLDIKMPGLDGYQVCSYIRKDLANKDVKVLAISGILDEEGAKKIMKLGADDYLAKPFDNQTLKIKIEGLLEANKAKSA